VKSQTKAPLSVGYKAVLVHEFSRPPKFALRSKIRNESSAEISSWTRPLRHLIPNLVEAFNLSLFLLGPLLADHMILT